jgi:hypothetical protein
MDIEVVVVYVGALCWNSSPWGPDEYNLEAQCKISKVQATGTSSYRCALKDAAKINLYILNLETTVKQQHATILEHVSFTHTFLDTQSEGISWEM